MGQPRGLEIVDVVDFFLNAPAPPVGVFMEKGIKCIRQCCCVVCVSC